MLEKREKIEWLIIVLIVVWDFTIFNSIIIYESDISTKFLKTSLAFKTVSLNKDFAIDIAKGKPNKRLLKKIIIKKHAILISHIVKGSIIFSLFCNLISGWLALFNANIL